MAAAFRPWLVTRRSPWRPASAGVTPPTAPLDARIAEAGRRRGTPVIGLETIEDQFGPWPVCPRPTSRNPAREPQHYDRATDLMETMVQRYFARDLGAMWPFQIELTKQAGLSAEGFKTFEHQLVAVRNGRMRDAALPLLREGGVFIGVGALPLPGRLGLVEMLREAGFTLTAIE